MKTKLWPFIRNLVALIENQEDTIEQLMADIDRLKLELQAEKDASAALARELAHGKGNDLKPWEQI